MYIIVLISWVHTQTLGIDEMIVGKMSFLQVTTFDIDFFYVYFTAEFSI